MNEDTAVLQIRSAHHHVYIPATVHPIVKRGPLKRWPPLRGKWCVFVYLYANMEILMFMTTELYSHMVRHVARNLQQYFGKFARFCPTIATP